MVSRIFTGQLRRSCCLAGNSAVYEVSIRFTNPSIREQYIKWLSVRHIQEVLQFDGFVSADLLKEVNSDDIVVKYILESPQVYDAYNMSDTAKRLREEAIDVFGKDSFTASRRILVVNQQFFR